MEIYLDHAATTPISEAVLASIEHLLKNDFGNPSSLHRKGVTAEKYIKESRRMIAKKIGVNEREILFTSGGTESNNLAIKGCLPNNVKGRIITTRIEHPSVKNVFEKLGKQGYEVIFLPVDSHGVISTNTLLESLSHDTLLVSIMHVNNEVGSIQPIDEVAEIIRKYNVDHAARIKFHVDGVQSFGKYPFPKGVDLYSFSGHKINGLKGSGGLYVKNGINLTPLFEGGEQENAIRPGTENILGITALGKATEVTFANQSAYNAHAQKLNHAMRQVFEKDSWCNINSFDGSPYILNVSFPGVKSEVLMHSLEMEGIYVSSGSACSSRKKQYSHVLLAMGLEEHLIDSAIRISTGLGVSVESAESAAIKILETAKSLGKIMRRK